MKSKIKHILSSILILVSSLILPGIAHFWLNQRSKALLISMLLFAGIAVMSWTGLLFLSGAFWVMIAFIGCVYIYAMYDAFIVFVGRDDNSKSNSFGLALIYTLVIIAFALLLVVKKPLLLGFQLYIIPSSSMYPFLKSGDLILADTRPFSVNEVDNEDVIVFTRGSRDTTFYIKRVKAIAGQTVEISEGTLAVSGQELVKDIKPKELKARKIAEDSVFVMGDNHKHSYDSRHWGEVSIDNVKAIYQRTLFSVK